MICFLATEAQFVSFCAFRTEGIDVRVVKRGEYDEEVVRWADAIISAGGRNFT